MYKRDEPFLRPRFFRCGQAGKQPSAQLAAGKTDIEITLSANADSTMFTAIRRALIDTEGVADGSINLTLNGVTTIPEHPSSGLSGNTAIFGKVTDDENGNSLTTPECVTQLKSVNLPDVLTIGNFAFSCCVNLTVLIAPKLQTVGEYAFYKSGLTSVDLPEATTIGGCAFLGIKATEFHLPEVTVLGDQTLDLGELNNEVTIYLTSADEIEVHKDCFYQMVNWYNSLATKVNLVLNVNKQSQVSDGNTWKGFIFKSIKFVPTPPTAIANLTYNGTEQRLITAGSTNGGTLQYSLNGTDWSTDLPTGKDADTYTVYYRVEGNDNYADKEENHFDVTIGKAALTITADNKSAVVGATVPELTYSVSVLFSGDTLTTEPTLTCSPDMDTADTYPITASGADAGTNYTIDYVAGALTVPTSRPRP